MLPIAMRVARTINKSFRKHFSKRNAIVQIRLKDNSIAHHYIFQKTNMRSCTGLHKKPDVNIVFKDADIALRFMNPNPDQGDTVHFVKNFQVEMSGDDASIIWFATLMNKMQSGLWKQGTQMPDGSIRYTTNTNGGPLFVFVKDGKIIRTTPVEFDDDDPQGWSIDARGKTFTPRRQSTVNVHALSLKSTVYSDRRLKYPMKRIDFDPDGERNPQNRGKSGYERISWDAALDIIAGEIKRQKTTYGPGSIAALHGAHHQMGNVGYWLSAFMRFCNIVGVTQMAFSPISWEGWYWGAQHHFGNSMRLGLPGAYGTVEDCLKNCEMIVFWSSDPESTSGLYAGSEGTQRRLWAKELGIEFVHIDPHYNATARLLGGKWLPVKPTTDSALAQAIMYTWLKEDSFDAEFIKEKTTGFDNWKDYLLGHTDGVAKTPKWQEAETGIPAKDVVSLARAWARKKTYLAAGGLGTGFGGACRSATGQQWARNMVMLMAMQGWGKPGVNFGNLQCGAPLDFSVYFPGYSEGGISGDLVKTGAAVNNYTRMPHVLSLNPVNQRIPRERLAEAIKGGSCSAHVWDGLSMEAQFKKMDYPDAGYSRIHMIYQYGASAFGTTTDSTRLFDMYRDISIDFVVNQAIWHEGETQFADIILPACSVVERDDISEVCGVGGFMHHNQTQMNHRIIMMQHKCIEPLWESRSDYRIFTDVLTRLGFGAMYSEGCDELDWCKRVFESSDADKYISWKSFLKRGYVVLPAEAESTRAPVDMHWFYNGEKKDVPEPHPLPADYSGEFLDGLQTQSGKFEFLPNSLRHFDPDSEERPVLNTYIPAWEGTHTEELIKKYSLQLITAHPRYSFHTHMDGKGSHIVDIEEHRKKIKDYPYWIIRLNSEDAHARGLKQHDLVKVFNGRATVICAVEVSPLVARGVAHSYESSAEFDFMQDESGEVVDRGGCLNLLTPSRNQAKGTSAIAPNSCLVEIERWNEDWEVING